MRSGAQHPLRDRSLRVTEGSKAGWCLTFSGHVLSLSIFSGKSQVESSVDAVRKKYIPPNGE